MSGAMWAGGERQACLAGVDMHAGDRNERASAGRTSLFAATMSESDVVPPDKRGDVWFDDGNIVLIANDDDGAVAFKIHRGMLARHSEVFSSMFEVAEPTEDIEQCPVVHMYDAPLELSCLIKALYDGVSL